MQLKTNLAILLGVLTLTGCNQLSNDVIEDLDTSTQTTVNNKRTIEEAYILAEEAAKMLNDNSPSRSSETRAINHSAVQYITQSNSRSETDTLMYIINYEDSLGYAIISAKTSVDPIIAVTEYGEYNNSNENKNPGLELYLDMAKDYIAGNGFIPITPDPTFPITETKYETVVISDKNQEPRVAVKWGQGGIYGAECPNNLSGCSNTAAGQAMTYFNYPTSIKLNYSGGSNLTLNWSDIKKHVSGTLLIDNCPKTVHSTIGKLLRQIGYDSNSTYYTDGSGTGTQTASTRNTMIKYGFNVGQIINYSNYCIVSNLGSGIILIRGDKANNGGGHMWVADGFKYKKQELRMYTRPQNSSNWTLHSVETQVLSYNHFNWGWNGTDNGYFNESVFGNTGSEYKYNVKYFTVNR